MAPSTGPGDFCERALRALEITLELDARGTIPPTGPLVVLANHPVGLLDGIVVGALLHRHRADVRILGNRLLTAIPGFAESVIPVDPFGGATSAEGNVPGMREAFRWVARGGALVVFPAGEVAHRAGPWQPVAEPPWHPALARLIRRSAATLLPVHLEAQTSPWFHRLGYLHPLLRTAWLPRELPNKRGTRVRVTVGTAMDAPARLLPDDDAAAMDALRVRCLSLPRSTDVPSRGAPIAPPEPVALLERELAALPVSQRLNESGSYAVYVATAAEVPAVLREIGRLRELTFRDAGEGTGRERDLDAFDQWYLHLFTWDRTRREVVGAYRLCRIDEVLRDRGVAGLYTGTLFHLDPQLFERLGPALELGRSFVRREHQRSFAALNLLWRGIGRYVAANPRYRHLLGAVSISDSYPTPVQWLLVRFLQHNHLDRTLAAFVRPRNAIRLPHPPGPLETGASDLDAVAARVRTAEPDGQDVPVLLRQYLRLGGRILGANRDPAFGNAIDQLIVVDLLEAPATVVRRYLGDDGCAALRAHHEAAGAGVAP